MSGAETVRFAVGSRDEPLSAVWRLVGGNDPYLGADRYLMGKWKLSLHKRDYVSAFTKESRAKFEWGSRVHKAWPRPPEFHPGWKRGPMIAVPPTSWGPRELASERWDEPVHWLDPPGPDKVLLLVTVLETPGGAPDGEILTKPEDRVVDSVTSRGTGETVYLIATTAPFTAQFYLQVERFLADPKNQVRIDPKPVRSPGALLIVSTDKNGIPWVTDMPAPFR